MYTYYWYIHDNEHISLVDNKVEQILPHGQKRRNVSSVCVKLKKLTQFASMSCHFNVYLARFSFFSSSHLTPLRNKYSIKGIFCTFTRTQKFTSDKICKVFKKAFDFIEKKWAANWKDFP